MLEKIGQLFEADAVTIWLGEKNGGTPHFALKGMVGFLSHDPEQLAASEWSFPDFEQTRQDPQQLILDKLPEQAPSLLAGVCEREWILNGVLNPIIRREELIGLIGIFYRKPFKIPP